MTLNKNFFMLTLAFFGLCTVAAALTVALSAAAPSAEALAVAGIAALVTGGLLWSEARHDLDPVLFLLGSFLALTVVCVAIYLFVAGPSGPAPKVAVGVAALGATAALTTTYRRQRSSSADFPNVLAASFQPSSLFERAGIQFTGRLQPGNHGKPHLATIFLQNCFDGPRTVTIQFDPASYAKYLRLQLKHQLTLGPAEVCKVSFPVVTPTYPGTYPLYFSLGVQGNEGRRVRLWRAQEASDRIKPAATAALLLVGHLAVGGGIRFTVGPLPDDLWAMELPPPVRESLWQPRLGTVPSFAAQVPR